MFWSLKWIKLDRVNVFGSVETRKKVCLTFFEAKRQEEMYD